MNLCNLTGIVQKWRHATVPPFLPSPCYSSRSEWVVVSFAGNGSMRDLAFVESSGLKLFQEHDKFISSRLDIMILFPFPR